MSNQVALHRIPVHVPQPEAVPVAHLVENFDKAFPRSPRPEKGTPPVAAKRDEMKIASPVKLLQGIAHRRKTRTLKIEGCGTRSILRRLLPEWYTPLRAL